MLTAGTVLFIILVGFVTWLIVHNVAKAVLISLFFLAAVLLVTHHVIA